MHGEWPVLDYSERQIMGPDQQFVSSLAEEEYRLIEEEHARLQQLLDTLHETCINLESESGCEICAREKLASCRGLLTSSFHNLLHLTDRHFQHEEEIMRNWPHIVEQYEQFRHHQQAHAAIMGSLRRMVDECEACDRQGNTAESYRRLHRRMSKLFTEHARLFDDPFIQSTR